MIRIEDVAYLGPPWSGIESIFLDYNLDFIKNNFGKEDLDFKKSSSLNICFFEVPLRRFCKSYSAAKAMMGQNSTDGSFGHWIRNNWIPYYYEKKLPSDKGWLDIFKHVDWFEPNLLSKYVGFKENFILDSVLFAAAEATENWPKIRSIILEHMKAANLSLIHI